VAANLDLALWAFFGLLAGALGYAIWRDLDKRKQR